MPPSKAALGAGSAWHSRAERRHSHPTNAAAPQANMVICRPEIETRWATPVARNTSQSARSIAAWSPTTSAAARPATWRLANMRRDAITHRLAGPGQRVAPGLRQARRHRVVCCGPNVAGGTTPCSHTGTAHNQIHAD